MPLSCAADTTVVVFGDSISRGNTLPASRPSKVWVQRVAELAEGRLVMVNESKAGRWSPEMTEFDAMLARRPRMDVLVLFLGTNDSNDAAPRLAERVTTNLRSMIERARLRHGRRLRVLLVGPPQLAGDRRPEIEDTAARNERLRALGRAYAELAQQMNAHFVGLYGQLPDSTLAADGMHPDVAGNEVIARILLPALLQMANP